MTQTTKSEQIHKIQSRLYNCGHCPSFYRRNNDIMSTYDSQIAIVVINPECKEDQTETGVLPTTIENFEEFTERSLFKWQP